VSGINKGGLMGTLGAVAGILAGGMLVV
jgi:hypothetical protein